MDDEKLKEILKSIMKNDKTPEYDYHGCCFSENQRIKRLYNRDGESPEPGKRWLTPYEIVESLLREIEAKCQK